MMDHFKLLRTLAIVSCLLCATSCSRFYKTNDPTTTVVVNPEGPEDKDFAALLEKQTRKGFVFKNFESVLNLHVTYLSPDFFARLKKRHADRFKRDFDEDFLKETSKKTAFFVSISAPNQKFLELNNRNFWSLVLSLSDGKTIVPENVKILREKERWAPDFHYISIWSQDFLIIFDTQTQLPLELSLNSSPANISMQWR